MKVYVFGNPLLKSDSLPLKILPRLKKILPSIDFQVTDPNENFPPQKEKNLIILDTVFGIKKPTIFDLDDLSLLNNGEKTPISPHDYDLLTHLLLLKKLKRVEKVIIIGIPPVKENKLDFNLVSTLLLKSGQRKTYKDQKPG
jgi:Ni,Fe-hydrogenase maturation factor